MIPELDGPPVPLTSGPYTGSAAVEATEGAVTCYTFRLAHRDGREALSLVMHEGTLTAREWRRLARLALSRLRSALYGRAVEGVAIRQAEGPE